MSDPRRLLLSRRDLLKVGGLTGVALGVAAVGPRLVGNYILPATVLAADKPPNLKLVGTDGWISLPPDPAIFSTSMGVTTHPDSYAPAGKSTYIFGFANASGLADDVQFNLKNKAQHSAPLFWAKEDEDFRIQLANVGLAQRPDLFDEHTVHWHGFKNVIPFFDGEPSGSVSIPQGQTFTYVYVSRDPGTYMFHCHVEDTEHVHMGMTGLVFVRPKQDGQSLGGFTKFAYNDGDGSTGFDREFVMFLSEVWGDSHWADAHIQLPEWSDYKADFSLLNGRVYPDTLLPNGSIARDDTFVVSPARDTDWNLVPPPGRPDLDSQPQSALVTANAGERVLLRFANLGFMEAALTIAGLKVRVVGRDATPMRGRTGFNTSYETDVLSFGAGESFDAIFTAPAFSGGSGSSGLGYDTYVLYNRAFTRGDNLVGDGGGQRTEIRVYPAGTLAPQAYPNQHPDDPA